MLLFYCTDECCLGHQSLLSSSGCRPFFFSCILRFQYLFKQCYATRRHHFTCALVASCSCPGFVLQELDTTLQVLGIDSMAQQPKQRVTLSPHVPSVATAAPGATLAQRPTPIASVMSSEYHSPHYTGRTTSEAGYRQVSFLAHETLLQ